MSVALLQGLQEWYLAQCAGDWEHSFGVTIGTLDNPGWTLSVDLTDTDLESEPFEELTEDYEDKSGWMICRKTGAKFEAAGGPEKLEDMVRVFLRWAASAA
ncbi:MAG: immunity 53 family protein [Rubrobacter sp.]|nr:immunity 53 family protein [Rubrobacter sp.]